MASVTWRRRTLFLTVMALVLIAVPGSALAGGATPPPPDSSTGYVGVYGFDPDTEAAPAGRCNYGITVNGQYYNYISRIGAIPPKAYARAGRASQRIGLRIVAQMWDGNAWVMHARSSWVFKTATPTSPAPFGVGARTVPVNYTGQAPFRAKVLLRWYAQDGQTVRGQATLYPDWYLAREGNIPPHVQQHHCGGTTG